jgi:hypothetical protein
MLVIAEVFDGLRDYYSRQEGPRSSPGLSAAAALAALLSVNLITITTLVDVVLNRRATVPAWIVHHGLMCVAISLFLSWAHIAFAKRMGVYDRTGPPLSATWRRPFAVYCVITVLLLAGVFVAIGLTRAR